MRDGRQYPKPSGKDSHTRAFPSHHGRKAFQFYSSNHLRLVDKEYLFCHFIHLLDNKDDTVGL